jgi:hypothetical protein
MRFNVIVPLEVKDEDMYASISDVTIIFPDDTTDSINTLHLFRVLSASIQRNNSVWRERTILLFTQERQVEIRKVLLTQPQVDDIDWKL